MTYANSDIKSVIKNGENSFIEFKEENARAESIAKELVAFLNFEGGTLYIGISDNGQITGVGDKNYEEWIMNICRNSISPAVILAYEEIEVGGKKVIRIQVGKGTDKPYRTAGNNRYYIRVGSTSREPSQQELIRLLQESNQSHYEITPVFGISLKDISKGHLQDYFEKRGIDIEHYDRDELVNFLLNTEILVEVNETKYVSFAGALFFAKNTGRWIKNAEVQLVRFDGNNVTDQVTDRKDNE